MERTQSDLPNVCSNIYFIKYAFRSQVDFETPKVYFVGKIFFIAQTH